MNEQIRQAAQHLALLISQSSQYTLMQEREQEALQDDALQAEYREYVFLRQQLQEMMQEENTQPDAMVELDAQVKELEAKLQNMDNMNQLNDAREAFSSLMDEVNTELQGILTPEEEMEGSACGSGGCAGCQGCGSPER
jgi:cell fate (sporulation/competence/biofilm development) regulator YlbF (YheA/YmcA/DUF963 family)